ncbi:YjfB family protein [Clostridium sp. C2-6-12]|uniref:YjfB family protein n=1 Tax=Clostridium sp. C2-6-12 TaxID=2698832 RepID=UPI00136CB0FD|nr:YjfB family protein [Clostridium sp. C2-6-12]
MDIAMLSIINNNNKINDGASLMVLKKAMDVSEQNSENMNQMLNQAVNPNIGTKIDRFA